MPISKDKDLRALIERHYPELAYCEVYKPNKHSNQDHGDYWYIETEDDLIYLGSSLKEVKWMVKNKKLKINSK